MICLLALPEFRVGECFGLRERLHSIHIGLETTLCVERGVEGRQGGGGCQRGLSGVKLREERQEK